MMNTVFALAFTVAVAFAWLVVAPQRRRRQAMGSAEAGSEEALVTFVERSLQAASSDEILADAAIAARAAFQARRVVLFTPGEREGAWEAALAASDEASGPLVPVPDTARSTFAWFKHNPPVVLLAELSDPRYGAMRVPLGTLKEMYEIDVLVPLVGRGQTMAALGLGLGRPVTAIDRSLLDDLRTQVAAAMVNVRLHQEASLKLTLEKEVDLAGALQAALLPSVMAGQVAQIEWLGHYHPAGPTGRDFWSAYDLGGGRVAFVVGDVVGTGVAASMVSAVAKSVCDTLFMGGRGVEADELLTALNRALYRPNRPINMTCFAAVLDPAAGLVRFANAGYPMPYHLRREEPRLGVLGASGPMLGDAPDTRYRAFQRTLEKGDLLVMHSDGVAETRDASRAPFGERRLQRVLASCDLASLSAVRDQVLAATFAHRGGGALDEDELLVLAKVT